MKLTVHPIQPVRKRRTVALPPEQAFDLFTSKLASWWPLATHSIAEVDAVDVRFEPRVGGRVIEVARDGSECNWADVLAWDPPHRVALAWHPNPEPTAATIVDVRFTAVDGGTQVDLEHHAFEELGVADGPAARAGYDEGWDPVLDDFAGAAR
jgi:uncharacterized protein YndB with AHSA1/START domain